MANIIKDAKYDTVSVRQNMVLPVVEQDINSPTKGKLIYNAETNVPSYADGLEWHDITAGANYQTQIDVINTTLTNISSAPVNLISPNAEFPNGSVITAGSGINVINTPGITTIEATGAPGPSTANVALVSASAEFPNGSVVTAGTGITITPGVGTLTVSETPRTLQTQQFLTNGVFNIPSNAQNISFIAQGAGGGGGGGTTSGESGGGGQAGCYIIDQPISKGGGTFTVTIGSGGSGGASADGQSGGITVVEYTLPGIGSSIKHFINGGRGGGLGIPTVAPGGGKDTIPTGPCYNGPMGGDGGAGLSTAPTPGFSSVLKTGGVAGSKVGLLWGGGGGGAGYLENGGSGGNGGQNGFNAFTGSGGGGAGGGIGPFTGGNGGDGLVYLYYYI